MDSFLQRIALVVLLFSLAGCSTVKDASDSVTGWFNGDGSTLSASSAKNKEIKSGPVLKYAATLRVGKYLDQRKTGNPRLLGITTHRVIGVSGKDLVMDEEISAIATAAIKRKFDAEGFQVLEGAGASQALFEVTGVIKDLTLNVKARDEINIEIETTLKDLATGKVVWSGLVSERHDRYAGVSGNNKQDVADYLNKRLDIASGKTVEAVSASLMAAYPKLFNLTPGVKPVPGVTVYTAPEAVQPAPQAYATPAPAARQESIAVPPPAYVPRASATTGLLLVNTNPQRAKVYLDGVYYGLSPLRLEMEPGIRTISVKLAGYKMVSEKVSVRKGDNTEMELNLER